MTGEQDRQIDRLVYKLYGLTEEEIVGNSAKLKNQSPNWKSVGRIDEC